MRHLRTSRELLVMPLEVADGSCELAVSVVEYALPISQDASCSLLGVRPSAPHC